MLKAEPVIVGKYQSASNENPTKTAKARNCTGYAEDYQNNVCFRLDD